MKSEHSGKSDTEIHSGWTSKKDGNVQVVAVVAICQENLNQT